MVHTPIARSEAVAITLDGSASLAGGEGEADLQITRLDGPEGDIALAGSYSNATGALNLDLSFREGPGGIAASLIGLPGDKVQIRNGVVFVNDEEFPQEPIGTFDVWT